MRRNGNISKYGNIQQEKVIKRKQLIISNTLEELHHNTVEPINKQYDYVKINRLQQSI